MQSARIDQLRAHYRTHLLENVVPFWLNHAPDREYGGYFNFLDRQGQVYDTDKAIWLQSRAVWMFAKLYNTVEQRPEWLEAARLGYDFLHQHAFDIDGRMFFHTTREGKPLRKRRYIFTETFGIIACAEYARASGDEQALQRAKDTYKLVLNLLRAPGALPPKVYPRTRQTVSHAIPMILLATSQEIRQVDPDPLYNQVIDDALDDIFTLFVKRDIPALLETVGPHGERLDSFEGRTINPGHAIESAWFIMTEGRNRNDQSLISKAAEIIDWSLDKGWDKSFGGLLYFVDAEGKPPHQLEWDMKLWWPHTEALYALLLAHHLTGEDRYADWHTRVHEWTFANFPDPEYGEWYGYLHRDGSISTPLKGGMWKGFFHLPRALWLCYTLLGEMQGQ